MNMSIGQSFPSFSATSQAQSKPPPPPPPPPEGGRESDTSVEEVLSLFDVDSSGDLTASEIEDSQLAELIGDAFTDLDADGDGALKLSELSTLVEGLTKSGSRPPPPPPPPSSEADISSLFEGLLTSADGSDTSSSDATAYAKEMYSLMLEISQA